MPAPTAITLTGDYGASAEGFVVIDRATSLTLDGTTYPPTHATVPLVNGAFSLVVEATDDSGVSPANSYYRITEYVNDRRSQKNIYVPAASPSATLDVNSAVTVSAVPGQPDLVIGANVQAWNSDLDDLVTRWTKASAAGPASLDFLEDTDNGTNKARLTAPAALGGDRTLTLPDATGTLLTNEAANGTYAPLNSGLIASKSYVGGGNVTTSSPTFADISAANLVVTFDAPASGSVVVHLNGFGVGAAGSTYAWNLRDGSGDVAGTARAVHFNNQSYDRRHLSIRVDGLTPGNSYTWKWGHASVFGGGTHTFQNNSAGSDEATMEVFACP